MLGPFSKQSEDGDLGASERLGIVWRHDFGKAVTCYTVRDDAEGGADVGADDGDASQGRFTHSKGQTFGDGGVEEEPCVLEDEGCVT
jgi:hypothetical protein